MNIKELSDKDLLKYHKLFKNASKRAIDVKIKKQETKFLTHAVRLLLQIEQIMVEHDLDLERNSEILKSVRKGEWTFEQLDEWLKKKESSLEDLYIKSSLPHSPDEPAIKELLLNCLEMHFGSLDRAVVREQSVDQLVHELKELVRKYE